jgi:OmpA-OmpF porin, OOP family
MGLARISALLAAVASAAAFAQQEPSPYSLAMSMGRAPGQGLNVSLVGRAQLSSFGIFGKVGSTTYARPETATMGMVAAGQPESGGLSWGGGVSYDVTPRLSATFEWVSYDLRMATGLVRSTSLGLQYRY